jgi:Response regulator containing CheY-like receiver domain and AraC-type DNA-binding domain
MSSDLNLRFDCPVRALSGGLFIATNPSHHPIRVIESYELILVRTGCLHIFEGETEYILHADQCLILVPGIRQGGSAPYSEDLSFYWLHFLLAPLGAPSPQLEISVPKSFHLRDSSRIRGYLHLFLDLQESQKANTVALSNLVLLILNEIAYSSLVDPGLTDAMADLVERIDTYIATNFVKPITSSDIAEHLNYNTNYLERVYRKSRGVTLTNAINSRRIKEACFMLLMPEGKNINEIAYQCGFTDPGYFRRVFRKVTTMAPNMYRRINTHLNINTQ